MKLIKNSDLFPDHPQVVLLGFGFVGWVFSLSPATDSEGRAKVLSGGALREVS
jgi:hypothetical protein